MDRHLDVLSRQVQDQIGLRDARGIVAQTDQLSLRLWGEPAAVDARETFLGLVDAPEATAVLELVTAHAKRVDPASPAGLADQLRGRIDARAGARSAAVLVTGLLALGASDLFNAEPGDFLDSLLHIAFATDDLSKLARSALLPGIDDKWPPMPDFGDLPGSLPIDGGCIGEVLRAGARLAGMVAGSRAAEQTVPVVDADGIGSLSPTGGSSGDPVTIIGTFPSIQPTGRAVIFPRAGGGTLQATVVSWGSVPVGPTATRIDVIAPDPVGDGPVGFITHSDEGLGSGDPTAAADFVDAIGGCLGPVAGAIAGRVANVPPMGIAVAPPPVPSLAAGANVFHGGPVLVGIAAASGSELDPPITVTGLNLRQGDVVMIENTSAATTFVNPSTLRFQVPAMAAGHQYLTIRRGYHRSNGAAFEVRAALDATPPSGRVQPGAMVELKGSGFGPSITATLDGSTAYLSVIDTHRIAVRMRRPARPQTDAEKRGEIVTVEVFDRGRSLGTVRVVVATLRIASFGDSIVWGQGLLEADKFTNRLATLVANRRHGSIAVYALDRFANSGATVLPAGEPPDPSTPRPPGDFTGECPGAGLSISSQVGQWDTRPDLMTQNAEIDLVVLDGGINDVGVATILNPFNSDGALANAAVASCGAALGGLLSTMLSTTFPRASIIVTGYYPIVSDQTDLDLLIPALAGVGVLAALVTSLIPGALPIGFGPFGALVFKTWLQRRLVDRSNLFASTANTALQTAVTTAVAAFGPRVALAVPAFAPANSIFAPDSFLWGVGISTAGLVPLDPVAPQRIAACGTSLIATIASIGHPNPKGAEAYAAAMEAVLPQVGF